MSTFEAMDKLDRRMTVVLKTGGTMKKHQTTYNRALNALADHIVRPGEMLQQLDGKRDQLPAAYYEQERQRLTRWARDHDTDVVLAMNQYLSDMLGDARKLRVQAQADRPAAERTAEMLERQQLVAASPRADDLVAQAAEALDADRPRRAALLLSVAKERGATFTSDLELMVEDALDEIDEKRASARAIEDEAETNYRQLEVYRLRALRAAGIGIREDGSAGAGTPGDLTRANVARKMVAFYAGEDFGDEPAREPQAPAVA